VDAAWVVTAAVACLGLVLVAVGRGHALRLLVQVKKGKDDDASGTAYVLARLQELGTSPPEGLKMPQQLDVDNLPTEALTSLPTGRLAAALASVLKVISPAIPWKAVVEGEENSSRVVVTLTRNGSVVRTALVDADGFLPKPGSSGGSAASPEHGDKGDEGAAKQGSADRGDLLTAAAAVVLTELARIHRQLEAGLCGASRWESVAAQVVATKPPSTTGGSELRRELLAYAVQADPPNALAQLALASLLGEDASSAEDLAHYATGLTRLLIDIEAQAQIVTETGGTNEVVLAEQARAGIEVTTEGEASGRSDAALTIALMRTENATVVVESAKNAAAEESKKQPTLEAKKAGAGYLPLRLRARHSLTATWLNVAVQVDETKRADVVNLAASNYGRLVTLLKAAKELEKPGQDVFLDEMSRVAFALRSAFAAFLEKPVLSTLPPPPRFREGASLESLHVLYDEACNSAVLGENAEALKKLERAVGLERYRQAARTDPCFEKLRRGNGPDDKDAERFWDLVGSPTPGFTDLPPFGKQGPALIGLGVMGPLDLLAISPDRGEALADALKVPRTVAAAWWAFARLAEPRPPQRSRWLDSRELALLAASGIRDDEALRSQSSADVKKTLGEMAQKLGLRPPTPQEAAEIVVTRDPDPQETQPVAGAGAVIYVSLAGQDGERDRP